MRVLNSLVCCQYVKDCKLVKKSKPVPLPNTPNCCKMSCRVGEVVAQEHFGEMSNRRQMRGLRRDERCHLGPFRLVLEPLESRRLLAGIHVSVYLDQDGSRNFSPSSDQAAPNRLVYVDLNSSGQRDPHEPVAVTDQDGSAFFADLEPGDYSIGLLTNTENQSQVDPVGLSQPIEVSSQLIANFAASDDLQVVWTIGADGVARLLTGTNDLPTEVSLGKIISLGQAHGDLLTGFVETQAGWQWLEFQLRTGEVSHRPVAGLTETARSTLTPRSIVESFSHTVVLFEGPAGNLLASGTQQSNQRQLFSAPIFNSAYAIAASSALPQIAALSASADGSSLLTLLNPGNAFAQEAQLKLDSHASSLVISEDGKFAFVTLSAGGVLAVAIGPQSLTLSADLQDAAGQVEASSADGRIVTGSSRSSRELITWDTQLWQPVGRTILSSVNNSAEHPHVAIESRGDRMLALVGGKLQAVEMAVPQLRRARLNSTDSIAAIQFGVRIEQPVDEIVLSPVQRTILEDDDDSFQLSQLVSVGQESDSIWFELDVPPENGRLVTTADGSWEYIPNPNFFGEDFARLLVYDGHQASQLVMRWNVAPVPDAPSSVAAGDYVLLENASYGTLIGPISVVDPDVEGSYEITTSDARFEVFGGNLYFVGGELNFEAEPQINFTITALDLYSSFSVSTMATVTIVDVNEKPFSLRLNGGQVPENEPGAVAGTLSIVDPDVGADYAFYVLDSRFTVIGHTLKLMNGVALDYETESVLNLTVAATDGSYEIFEVVQIHVIDRNDTAATTSTIVLGSQQIEELVPGASVGTVSVVNPKDSLYQFSVSDSRFEIAGNLLKLRVGEHVTVKNDDPLSLTITGTGDEGDRASGVFAITIIANQSPYHNSRIPEDVNGDGYVSPIDVLIVVNGLNQKGTFPVPAGGTANGEPPSAMPDVNDDGVVSPVDALIIINHINRHLSTPVGSGEQSSGTDSQGQRPDGLYGEGESSVEPGGLTLSLPESDAERRRRDNITIDAELEILLDQLSRAKRY